MNININDYKMFRRNKIELIKKRLNICSSIFNQVQTGGNITKNEIDSKYNIIANKINKVSESINELNKSNIVLEDTVKSQNNDIELANSKIKEIQDLIDSI